MQNYLGCMFVYEILVWMCCYAATFEPSSELNVFMCGICIKWNVAEWVWLKHFNFKNDPFVELN